MKNILDRYVSRYGKKHRDFRRYAVVVAVLALVVFIGVNWRLHDKGISMTSDYQCGLKEHKHTDKCYRKVLICGKEETDGSEGHTHTADCYKEVKKLTCGKEEHKHNADCYDEDGNLICGKEEHEHSDDCYTTEKKRICGKKESKPVAAHHHTDDCYKKELICGLEEHTHTAACYSNESADVEKKSDWEATIPVLSGNWEEDIVSVAQSQIGYEESTANFKLADDGKTRKGYTRYGEWYGNKYGDWSAMFASFCLNYAGIPSKTVPVNSGCPAWITELKQDKLYKTAANYTPAAGDIVFLDTDSDGKADHAGIITETKIKENTADNKVTSLTAIVGDSSDKVEENTYKTADDVILGYCALPENPDEKKVDTTEGKEAESTETEKQAKNSESTTAKGDGSSAGEGTVAKMSEEKASENTTKTSADATEKSEDTTAITQISNKRKTIAKSKNSIAVQNVDDIAVQMVSGQDMTDFVTSVKLYKKVGQLWEESSEFNTSDSVKAEISFANVPKSNWIQNNNIAYIRLPEGFDCSKFVGQTYDAYDGKIKSGKYTYEQDAEGHWNIVLELNDDYVNKVVDGGNIGGKVDLEYEWDKTNASEEGKKETITIGQWSGAVTIKKDKKEESSESGHNFSISKDAGSLTYDKDKNAYYITYKVELTVKNDTKAPIELTDNLTGNDWEYDENSLKLISANNGETPNISWNSNQKGDNNSDKKSTISIGTNGTTIKAGKYTLTYKVKNSKISEVGTNASNFVSNKVSVSDKDETISAEKWTSTTPGKVNKRGEKVDGEEGNTYIDYTVYLNAGDIVKNLKQGAQFTDVLPDDLELVGDVAVEQYDATGNQISTSNASVNGKTISYTTPTGQYYYKITYRTKVKSENIPIGGKNITNTGESKGGIEGSGSSTVNVPNNVLNKRFDSQNISQDAEGKWTNTMQWTSTINVDGSLKDYIYEDWGQLGYVNNKNVAIISMTPEQRKSIKILDKNGNEISSGYNIEDSTHQDYGINNGLFKIKFTDDINGPVTIQYETTADLSGYNVGTWIQLKNYASVTDRKGDKDNSEATSDNIQYNHEKPDIIIKKRTNGWDKDNSNITLEPGQTSIPWTIMINRTKDATIKGDLIVTDEIADGMAFIESSFNIVMWADNGHNTNVDQITWKYDETTHKLTVKIPESAYHGIDNNGVEYSNTIIIAYRTELPKDYLSSSDLTKSFSNTASIEINGEKTDSSFTQEVTRRVVGKSGNYDAGTKTLTYEMILNPEACKLNEGNTLTVKDILTEGVLKEHIELKSLKLFSALKTVDSNHNTKIEPGKLEKVLIQSDSTENFNYQWDKSTGIFTTYIPDEKAYVLVAEYSVDNSSLADDIRLSNTVQLSGYKKWSADNDSVTVSKKSSAETYTDGDYLTVIKHDADQYNTLLNGAEFKLEKYENGDWIEVKTVTTGKKDSNNTNAENGRASAAVARNTLYRLTETKAPEGYKKGRTSDYFVIIAEGETFDVPNSITGDKKYKKESVKIYTVEKDNDKYTDIVVDRYNARDTTIVEKGQVQVNKIWIDSAGEEIKDPIRLSKLEAKVTLTKEKKKEYKVVLKCNGASDKVFASGIKNGACIFIKAPEWIESNWKNVDLPAGVSLTRVSEGENTGQDPVFKLGPITSDINIESSSVYWNPGVFEKQEGGDESGVETTSETVTLNSENDWSWVWTDLESDDRITYTITEETVDGYATTYELNKEDLEKNKSFSLGTNGDKITVINTSDSDYILPETGGSGTLPFIAVGASLMGFALLCGYSMRRRRGRRVE